jgi:hypothetical protein
MIQGSRRTGNHHHLNSASGSYDMSGGNWALGLTCATPIGGLTEVEFYATAYSTLRVTRFKVTLFVPM